MKKPAALGASLLVSGLLASPLSAAQTAGAAAFEANCSECHPGGENLVTPAKNLKVTTLKANGIRTPEEIVAKMRNPGPGMTRFNVEDLPEKKALEIAGYIFATFR